MKLKIKSYSSAFLFFFIVTKIFSQTTISGIVRDIETEKGIELATIIVNDNKDSLITFDITDNTGRFSIVLHNYFINNKVLAINHLSYKEKKISLDSIVNLSDLRIDMVPKANELGVVSITSYKSGITINGDTTKYHIDAFKSGHENTLSEVLNKMPGIEYEENGNIKYGGKSIDKVLIEGDDILNHDRSSLVKGLLIKDVDKIEVIENYIDQNSIKDQNDIESKLALNIKLKDSSINKTQLFTEGGYGIDSRFNFKGNAYRIGKEKKFIGNLITNNIGLNELSLLDYINIEGGFESFTESSHLNNIPSYFKNQRDAAQNSINHSSISFSQEKGKTKHHAYLLGIANNRIIEEVQINQIGSLNREFFTKNTSNNKLSGILGKYRNTYNFSKKKQLKTSIAFSFNDEYLETRDSFSFLNINYNTNIKDDNTFKNLTSSIDFTHNYKSNLSYTLGVESKFRVSKVLNYIKSDNSNQIFISNSELLIDSISQDVSWNNTDIKTYVEHKTKIRDFSFPTTFSWTISEVNVTNFSSLQNIVPFPSKTNWGRNYWELNQGVLLKKNNYRLGGNVRLRKFIFKDKLIQNKIQNLELLPIIFFRYSKQGKFVGLNIKREIVFPEVQKPYNSLYFEDIDRVQYNRLNLEEVIDKRSILLNMGKITPLKGESIFIFGQLAWNRATIKNQSFIDNNELYFYEISKEPLRTIFIGSMYDKKLFAVKVGFKVKLDILLSELYSNLNEEQFKFVNKIWRSEISAYSRYEKINWESKLTISRGTFGSQANSTNELNYILDLKLFGNFFSKRLYTELRGNFIYQKSDFGTNAFPQLGLNAYFNPKNNENLRVGFESNNLLTFSSNTLQSIRRTDNSINYTLTSIIPSYLIFQIKYQF